jgi:hypothetical protein
MIPYDEIRTHYEHLTPMIMEVSERHPKRWVDPYCAIPFHLYYTPIEEMAWMAIRSFGHVPMYPQYPVLGYFIDFANPFLKIGIECDGAMYHTDKEKDRRRDAKLYDQGWLIFRISGSDCYKVNEQWDNRFDVDEMEASGIVNRYYNDTIEGLVRALGIFYCGYRQISRDFRELELAHGTLSKRSRFVSQEFLDEKFWEISQQMQECFQSR